MTSWLVLRRRSTAWSRDGER